MGRSGGAQSSSTKAVLGVVLLSMLIVLGALGAACGLQRRVLYPRPAAGAAPPLPPGATRVALGPSSDWEAFFLRPAEATAPFPAVIFAHGNGELIDHWLRPFGVLPRAGIGVLLIEYPGYGRSGGSPTQQSITSAIVAGYDFLTEQRDVDRRRVVAYGRSLGGGAACALALERPVAGLILESSFTSVRALAPRFGLPGMLVLDPFDNLSAVRELDLPILVVHGERDQLIPVAHGEALARAAGSELVRLPCGHNDCARPWAQVLAFLRESGVARPRTGG